MKSVVKLIIGYLIIIPAYLYWMGKVGNIDILKQMSGELAPGTFELSSGLMIPLAITLMVFPLISGILGISVYKRKNQCKIAGLILTALSLIVIIFNIVYSFETYTFPHVVGFYIIGGLLGVYVYKRKN
jgi:hypothetical protein